MALERSAGNAPTPVPEIKELHHEILKTDKKTDGSIPIEVDFLPPVPSIHAMLDSMRKGGKINHVGGLPKLLFGSYLHSSPL